MARDEFDDELDLEEERYFSDIDFDDENYIEDIEAPPVGDFDDDESLDDIKNDDELINDNFFFGEEESYEEEIESISVDVDSNEDLEDEDFENSFFNKDEEEWGY